MRALLLLPALLAVFFASAHAQDIRGQLQGRTVDSAGNPVGTVSVTVRSPDLQGERTAASDEQGQFVLRWLPVGVYEVELSRIGYEALLLEGVVVRLGRTTTVGEVQLVETPIELDVLEATAQRRLVDPESTAGGVNLTPALYDNLPNDRDYGSLTLLAPAADEYAGADLTVSGATGPGTKFFIEGADVTDPFDGMQATRLPYNFVQEVEIKTGGYEAEYQSTLGGLVNVVTLSGGNDYRGQVFGYYTNDRLEGDPRFGLSAETRNSSAQYDIGGSLGGPILPDRLWFFAAYNPTVVTEDIEIPAYGTYDDRSVQHLFAAKLTWRAADRTNVFFTVFGDPGTRDRVEPQSISTAGFTPLNPEPWLMKESYGSTHLVLGGTEQLGSRGLLEASFSTMDRSNSATPVSEVGYDVQFHDYTTETVSGGATKYGDVKLGRTSLSVRTTWELGRHTMKAGGEFSTSSIDETYTHNVIKKFAADSYTFFYTFGSATLKNRVGGLFVQDSWQVSERWRFNLGLRWEAEGLLDSNGEVAQTINDEFAPRLGFIFQPGRLGTQRVYGSAGRFYQHLHLTASGYFDGATVFGGGDCDGDPRDEATTCDEWNFPTEIAQATEGLRGQHFDELTLGYQRQIGEDLRLGVRGVYRRLRRAIEDGVDTDTDEWVLGNPGFGALAEYPKARREYKALELTAERTLGTGLMLVGSYVLSQTEGNYPGLFETEYWAARPNIGLSFDYPDLMVNADGLLPQHRQHSFKLGASYATTFGLGLGTRLRWTSGAPISIRGGSKSGMGYAYLAKRGSMGTTPNVWGLDLRLAYDLGALTRRRQSLRLILDMFNIGNPRTELAYDDICCFSVTEDGEQADPNPNYLEPTRFQAPFMARLGLEFGF